MAAKFGEWAREIAHQQDRSPEEDAASVATVTTEEEQLPWAVLKMLKIGDGEYPLLPTRDTSKGALKACRQLLRKYVTLIWRKSLLS